MPSQPRLSGKWDLRGQHRPRRSRLPGGRHRVWVERNAGGRARGIRGLSAAAATSRLAGECVVASYCSIAMNFRFSAELPVKDLSSSDRRL